MKNHGFARLPNHLETASARALVKWPILAKMSILLREFGHASGPGFGPQGDLTKSLKQSIISEEKEGKTVKMSI